MLFKYYTVYVGVGNNGVWLFFGGPMMHRIYDHNLAMYLHVLPRHIQVLVRVTYL